MVSNLADTIKDKAKEGADPAEVIGALGAVVANIDKSLAFLSASAPEGNEPATFSTQNKATETKKEVEATTESPTMSAAQKEEVSVIGRGY